MASQTVGVGLEELVQTAEPAEVTTTAAAAAAADSAEYEVEQVLGVCVDEHAVMRLLIQWNNYPTPTWEPLALCHCSDKLKLFNQQQRISQFGEHSPNVSFFVTKPMPEFDSREQRLGKKRVLFHKSIAPKYLQNAFSEIPVSSKLRFQFPGISRKRVWEIKSRKPRPGASPCPVLLIDDFLTVRECGHLLELASVREFEDSFTDLSVDHDQVYDENRTSCFVNLKKSEDVIIRQIEQRAADLVGVNVSNLEPLQIVRYLPGERFRLHHDAGIIEEDGSISMHPPIRLYTLFIYLNSLDRASGGETVFPYLGFKVHPQQGQAVFFPNLYLSDGHPDLRVAHEARPLKNEDSMKFGVNIWVTMSDFQILATID